MGWARFPSTRARAWLAFGALALLLAVALGAGLAPAALAQATPEPDAAQTPEPSPVPRVTSTPRPDGSVIHIVQPGDTLSQVARDYGVSLDELRALNAEAIGEGDLIYVGQALVIVPPPVTPSPTPPPTALPTATPSATPTRLPPPTATPRAESSPLPAGAAVCVLAFHDRDGNRVWEPGQEELLPGAVFTLTVAGAALRYTTDGVLEPYCFAGLAAGAYSLTLQPPRGYRALSASTEVLTVSAPITRAFGCQRDLDLLIAPTAAAPTGGLASAPIGQKLLLAAGLLAAGAAAAALALRLILARGGPLL